MRATSATGEAAAREAGFTLLEVLVVVGLLALLSALVFPAVRPALTVLQLESARTALASNLRAARAQAIRREATVDVDLAPLDGGYAWNGRRVELPKGARLVADVDHVSFAPDGTSAGGRFAVVTPTRALGVQVRRPTGVVEYGHGG